MKLLLSMLLALALSLAVMAQSQGSSSSQSDQSNQNNQATQGTQGSQGSQNSASSTGSSAQTQGKMSGTVSKDAKSITTDQDNKTYSVNNPDALKGHEGQHVAVVVGVDPSTNTIHIIQLESPQP